MKIKIRNFGPIKEFDLDLEKDFVGIFGKNNAGKSYAISVVYLIIKHILELRREFPYYKGVIMGHSVPSFFVRETSIKKECEKIFAESLKVWLSKRLYDSFQATFDDLEKLKNGFCQEKIQISLCSKFFEVNFEIDKDVNVKSVNIFKDVVVKKAKINKSTLFRDKKVIIYLTESFNITTKIETFIHTISSSFFEEFTYSIAYTYYLPASRSGLYQALNTFSQIFAELAKNRKGLFTKKVEIPNISEPVSDYFLQLSEIHTKKLSKDNTLLNIIKEIEDNILKGEVSFDDESKKIFYKHQNLDFDLDISTTSSMVSEISPIVSYLKYIISTKSLLFIEEPEAHLHPEVQVRLMEIFCQLSKIGVKIVITSHSNYIFNKFNNLVMSKELDKDTAQILVFQETPTGNIAKNIPIDDLGADDENFLDVAEKLYEEKLDIIDKLNEEVDV